MAVSWVALLVSADAAAETLSDRATVEDTLLTGKIVKSVNLDSGVTRSRRIWLEKDDLMISAVFKTVDIHTRGYTRFASGNSELGFSDSYRYELAAYLIDQEIGLDMVPVTVIRKIHGKRGSLTHWLVNAITEQQRIEQGLRPENMQDLLHQWADMRTFDALIYNTDRNAGNQLYTLEDWRLRLIDHSRAFRKPVELTEEFRARPMTVSRALLDRLRSLEGDRLAALLKRILGPDQINGILGRRDLLLEKVESDRIEYGDAFVFREGPVNR